MSGVSPLPGAYAEALLRRAGFDPAELVEFEIVEEFNRPTEVRNVRLKSPPVPPLARSDEHTPRGQA